MKSGTPLMERGCAKCGKIFLPAAYHRFRDDHGWYCSWTCFNHRAEGRTATKRVYKRVLQYDEQGNLVREHGSASDAAEFTGFGLKLIQKACRNHEPYKGFLWAYEGVVE